MPDPPPDQTLHLGYHLGQGGGGGRGSVSGGGTILKVGGPVLEKVDDQW